RPGRGLRELAQGPPDPVRARAGHRPLAALPARRRRDRGGRHRRRPDAGVTTMDDKLYLKQGTTADASFSLVVTPERAGWAYSGLKLLTLPPGGTQTWATGDDEILVLPLSGGATVICEGATFELQGRRSVFSRVTDFSYAPRDATVTVESRNGGTFAIPSARCTRRLAPRYGPAEDVP